MVCIVGLFKVYGNSMLPRMSDGDFVLTSRMLMTIKVGDDLVVDHPVYGRLIKRVSKVADDGLIRLSGENASSVSSDDMGWVSSSDVLGKVYYLVKCRRN